MTLQATKSAWACPPRFSQLPAEQQTGKLGRKHSRVFENFLNDLAACWPPGRYQTPHEPSHHAATKSENCHQSWDRCFVSLCQHIDALDG